MHIHMRLQQHRLRLRLAGHGLILGVLLGMAAPAFAASEGEYCGYLGYSWSAACDTDLRCDIRWSLGFLGQVGVCSAEDTAATCGGLQGAGCAEDQFCDFALEASCGAADRTGTCTEIPEICTLESRPVCGCDDKPYASPCDAHSHGIAVASEGACAPSSPCKIAGCSGELCVAQDDSGISPCIFRPEYACYRAATCEQQSDGGCGWTQTPELTQCLEKERAVEPEQPAELDAGSSTPEDGDVGIGEPRGPL